jgi:hypothetical protein
LRLPQFCANRVDTGGAAPAAARVLPPGGLEYFNSRVGNRSGKFHDQPSLLRNGIPYVTGGSVPVPGSIFSS